jgi:hypothetical protein
MVFRRSCPISTFAISKRIAQRSSLICYGMLGSAFDAPHWFDAIPGRAGMPGYTS